MSKASKWFKHLGHKIKHAGDKVGDAFKKAGALGLPSPDPATQAGETAEKFESNQLPGQSDTPQAVDRRGDDAGEGS